MVDVLITEGLQEDVHFSVVGHKASIARRTTTNHQPMSGLTGPIAVMLLWGPFIPLIAGMLLLSQN